MSDIDFQNGFVCGMATKGLTRSGDYYKPNCWNDEGMFDYFYIDFHRAMQSFSLGMFNESIVVFDSEQISVTNVVWVSTGVYKVYADISDKIHGVTVLNRAATTKLRFAAGGKLSAFSTHFWVVGIMRYEEVDYVFETITYEDSPLASIERTASVSAIIYTPKDCSEATYLRESLDNMFGEIVESCSIVLT